jgi:SLOG cluster3 family
MTSIRSLRLRGVSVFLSASVPDPRRDQRFNRIADAPFHVEQAVVSLARAVFSEDGRLVFGGHPSISPLVAIVAGEYRDPNLTEGGEERAPAPVVIYQSEAFRESIPHDTELLIQLGLAEEHWIKAVDGEHFVPGKGSAHEQCPRSLIAMRLAMIEDTDPAAMVCIGGMEGVLLEAEMFRAERENRPVFTLARTGGAASIIANWRGRTVPIDSEITHEFLLHLEGTDETRAGAIEIQPYPLIMQTIIDRIAPPGEMSDRRR